jgi:hypothetical protein
MTGMMNVYQFKQFAVRPSVPLPVPQFDNLTTSVGYLAVIGADPNLPGQRQRSNKVDFNMVGSLGYRYQKPTGNFVFRSGVGYPNPFILDLEWASKPRICETRKIWAIPR